MPVKLTCTGTPILVEINHTPELEVGKCLTCHTPLCPLCNCDHAMVSQLLGDLELVDFIAKCIHSICSLVHVYYTKFCTGTMILPMVVPVYRWYGTISKCTTLHACRRRTLPSPPFRFYRHFGYTGNFSWDKRGRSNRNWVHSSSFRLLQIYSCSVRWQLNTCIWGKAIHISSIWDTRWATQWEILLCWHSRWFYSHWIFWLWKVDGKINKWQVSHAAAKWRYQIYINVSIMHFNTELSNLYVFTFDVRRSRKAYESRFFFELSPLEIMDMYDILRGVRRVLNVNSRKVTSREKWLSRKIEFPGNSDLLGKQTSWEIWFPRKVDFPGKLTS